MNQFIAHKKDQEGAVIVLTELTGKNELFSDFGFTLMLVEYCPNTQGLNCGWIHGSSSEIDDIFCMIYLYWRLFSCSWTFSFPENQGSRVGVIELECF